MNDADPTQEETIQNARDAYLRHRETRRAIVFPGGVVRVEIEQLDTALEGLAETHMLARGDYPALILAALDGHLREGFELFIGKGRHITLRPSTNKSKPLYLIATFTGDLEAGDITCTVHALAFSTIERVLAEARMLGLLDPA